jgi:hypothetical protein
MPPPSGLIHKPVYALRTSETSVCYSETTRGNIPEDYHLHDCLREDLKTHTFRNGQHEQLQITGFRRIRVFLCDLQAECRLQYDFN